MEKKMIRSFFATLCIAGVSLFSLLSTAHAAGGDVEINAENFPDENFRAYVSTYDADGDGVLSLGERNGVVNITLSDEIYEDLSGIEFFPNLGMLQCREVGLKKLDVSQNSELIALSCLENPDLAEVDLTKNSKMLRLTLSGSPAIKAVDLTACPELTDIYLEGLGISDVDLSGNTKLTYVYLKSLNVTSLDLSHNTSIVYLDVWGSALTELNVQMLPELEHLDCDGTNVTELDVSKNPELTYLSCRTTSVASLDLSKNAKLRRLECNVTEIETLDLSHNPELIWLDCYSIPSLKELNVSKNTELQHLSVWNDSLTELDLSANSALTYLAVGRNKLTKLDVSNMTELTYLGCESNQLESLDLSNNKKLESLNFQSNRIPYVDLSNQVALTEDEAHYSPQNISLPVKQTGNGYYVDLSKIVPELDHVSLYADTLPEGTIYDETTGRIYFTAEPVLNERIFAYEYLLDLPQMPECRVRVYVSPSSISEEITPSPEPTETPAPTETPEPTGTTEPTGTPEVPTPTPDSSNGESPKTGDGMMPALLLLVGAAGLAGMLLVSRKHSEE